MLPFEGYLAWLCKFIVLTYEGKADSTVEQMT